MKKLLLLSFILLGLIAGASAQTDAKTSGNSQTSSADTPKKVIFRPTKDQITQVQTMLKQKGVYRGDTTGKLNTETRSSIKSWQKDNGLKQTGTLNRATLEKMGIELTEKQKLIPASESSYAKTDAEPKKAKTKAEASTLPVKESSSEAKAKRTIFRATKDQVNAAQRMLKEKGMYSGGETGKLDDATRAGLKKFQDGNGLKVTGTLNQATLEKMGIELTEKQKAGSKEDDQ